MGRKFSFVPLAIISYQDIDVFDPSVEARPKGTIPTKSPLLRFGIALH
jgi:hypothetical protein